MPLRLGKHPLKGPHWADPLKAWGDLLATKGKTKEALAKYDAAVKYAPNWRFVSSPLTGL
jgi:hypothetical protein